MVCIDSSLKKYLVVSFVLLAVSLFAANVARAITYESLLSPGPLIKGHQKIEDSCSKCHDLFKKSSQNIKCLACHKEIKKDLKLKRGFHGKSSLVLKEECKKCHADHKGRSVDIINLDQDTFDHKLTEFVLKGKHKEVLCSNCHRSEKKFRETPRDCFSCHKTDDLHLGRMGKKCGKCHSNDTWLNARFDHNKTHFKLTGKHFKVACNSCHPGQRFKNTPVKCAECHSLNDVHLGKQGNKCEKCHTSSSWTKILFDHDRNTKFPLKGSHKKVRCSGCHKEPVADKEIKKKMLAKVKKVCVGCHQNDDTHKGRFGVKCEKCHETSLWRTVRFNHDRDTKFKVEGAHRKLSCDNCHKGNLYKDKLKMKCIDCHKDDDVHKGQEGEKCGKCHTQQDWTRNVKFDHSKTRFPLTGGHRTTTCENCHLTAAFKDAPMTCSECHQSDDIHKGRFGKKCEKCHETSLWRTVRFNHDKDTKFKVEGAHRKLSCENCHKGDLSKDKLKTRCIDCHKDDDVHKGQEGEKCDKCHTQQDWARNVKFDHSKTRFPLTGGHATATCENCHLTAAFKDAPMTCAGCHQSDDIHKGHLGRKCEKCHESTVWRKVPFNHDKDTKFKIVGAHRKLSCDNCHKGDLRKDKLKTLCIDCHKDDDVHKGQEGEKCEKCHVQQDWKKNVKFDHSKTRFPLKGSHATTICENCHLTAAFKDAPMTCAECHQSDDIHKGRFGKKCEKCHELTVWRTVRFDHDKDTKFTIVGAHRKLSCENCHKGNLYEGGMYKDKLKMRCIDCHKDDDVHKGQEGKRCDKCHNSNEWRKSIRFEHDIADFPLIGMHAVATCENCHLSANFKSVKSKCVECHKDKDVHKGKFGADCQACHNPNGWKLWLFEHDVKTKFPLEGVHRELHCEVCHKDSLFKKVEMGKDCYECHREEDIHRGGFGRKCGRCHTSIAWDKLDIKH